MKNVMLRATRTFIEDLCAPEYAHNHLAVEISHPDGFTDTQELSIRVYSSEYRLLGCDTRSLKGKRPRKVRFDILSEEEWEAGLYRIYVYHNGRPVGWTLLELYSGYECWDKTEVEDFQTRPEEKYFAETFCFLPLFSWMHQEQCDSNLIRQFLETLYASTAISLPCLTCSFQAIRPVNMPPACWPSISVKSRLLSAAISPYRNCWRVPCNGKSCKRRWILEKWCWWKCPTWTTPGRNPTCSTC